MMKNNSRSSTVFRITALSTLAALLLAAGAALAATPALKTAQGDLLLGGADGPRFVQPAGGERVELPLPASSRVSDFRSASGGWLVAAVSRAGDSPALELLHGHGGKVTHLPSPTLGPSAELMEPMFLADQHGFQALVWLAGNADDRMSVQAARWLAGGWSAPETISQPGTQIALATAVLTDGSWLVVWAAFDGRDDEIVWSRFADGAWSEPRPIAEDNAVPDVTPSLHATSGGALVAWSRYDGNDYRVNVARFDGEGWSAPVVAGPAGSIDPAFSGTDAPYLTYRHAAPTGWGVMALDDAGVVLREARLPATEWRRPLLAVSGEGVRFEWVDLEQKSASVAVAWMDR